MDIDLTGTLVTEISNLILRNEPQCKFQLGVSSIEIVGDSLLDMIMRLDPNPFQRKAFWG